MKLLGFLLTLLTFGMLLLNACKKSEYLTDGGLSSAQTNLTTYDFLKNHQYHLFDTLVLAIDHFNLKEEVNRAGTFFAPTDYSLHRYGFDLGGSIDLNSLYSRMTADSIRQYMFAERIQITDFSDDTPKVYTNLAKTTWTSAVGRQQQVGYNQWSGAPVYFLYLTRVVGTLDVPVGSGNDRRSRCQTTGIQTSTGILHALESRHIFIRFN